MGGPQGDGKWHEFAWHGNISRTTLRIWIDDVLVFERTDMPWAMYGYAAFPNGYYPSNQGVVDNDDDGIGDGDEASSPDLFTDYDDHTVDTAVSNNGKLEC